MMKTQNLFPLCAALSVLFFMFTSDARAQEALDERPSHAEIESIVHSGIPVEVFEEAQKTLHVITEGATPYIRRKYERGLALLFKRAQDAGMTRASFGRPSPHSA